MFPRTMKGLLYTVCSIESLYCGSDSQLVFRLPRLFLSLTKLAKTLCLNQSHHSHPSTVHSVGVRGEQLVLSERCTSCWYLHHAGLSSTCSSHTCSTPEGQACEARHFQFNSLKSIHELHNCHAGKLRLFHKWSTPYHLHSVVPSREKRQFHICSAPWHHQICKTGEDPQRQAPVRHSSAVAPKKRIRLHQSEEIDQVLAESTETILEFAAVLGCSSAEATDMVRRDTRLVTQFNKQIVISKMHLLLHHGFQPGEIMSRSVLTESIVIHGCMWRAGIWNS